MYDPLQTTFKALLCPTEQSDTSLEDLNQILPLYISSIANASIRPINDAKVVIVIAHGTPPPFKERKQVYQKFFNVEAMIR